MRSLWSLRTETGSFSRSGSQEVERLLLPSALTPTTTNRERGENFTMIFLQLYISHWFHGGQVLLFHDCLLFRITKEWYTEGPLGLLIYLQQTSWRERERERGRRGIIMAGDVIIT